MNNYSAPLKVFLPQPVPSMAAFSKKFSNFVIWFPTALQHGIVYFYETSYIIESIPIMKNIYVFDSIHKILINILYFTFVQMKACKRILCGL